MTKNRRAGLVLCLIAAIGTAGCNWRQTTKSRDVSTLSPDEARLYWLAEVAKPDVKKDTILAAVRFFSLTDKPAAEKLILRGQTMDPTGPWPAELGRLYFLTLVGATSATAQGVVGTVNEADAHGAYAEEIRRFLASSSDVTLLAVTAEALATQGRTLYEKHSIDFDPVELANTYLARASKLDPRSAQVRQSEENIRSWVAAGNVPLPAIGASPGAQDKGPGDAAGPKQ